MDFKASTKEPLIISNNYLGYNIKAIIEKFHVYCVDEPNGSKISLNSTKGGDIIQLSGYYYYEPIKTSSHEKMDLFENVSLGSSSFNGTYNYAPLEQVGNIQNCKAVVRILKFDEPFTQSFVFNPTPIFDFSIKLDKKVFIQDEQIVLDYDSSVGDLIVSTNLIFPDGSSDEVEFPYEVVNKQIGTYELQVTASKEGYKTISLDEQFGVIGQDAEVQGADFSKEGLGKVERERDHLFWSIFGFILIVLVVIVFFVYRKILKQR